MKIYSRTGDQGSTHLLSGERVSKSNERIEIYGDLDELNASLGMLAANLVATMPELSAEVQQIQSILFQIGSLVAFSPNRSLSTNLPLISITQIQQLEQAIDQMESVLPALKNFILPGGDISAASAHLARTVCRRAERHLVGLFAHINDNEITESLKNVLAYLNRLSDYLFVLARYCNFKMAIKEKIWSGHP